jgi:hypothetical protein
MPVDLLNIIKASSDLVKGLKEFQPKPEKRDRLLQDDISRALRTLHFSPRGIVSLLKEVANGETLTEERIQQALTDFNDREWRVEEVLRRINYYELEQELGLSLGAIRVLEQLRYGKIDLRRAVQSEVNPYGQDGAKPNKGKARKLITAIENLNADIEVVEGIINTRARGGPTRKKPAAKKERAVKKNPAAPKKRPQKAAASRT